MKSKVGKCDLPSSFLEQLMLSARYTGILTYYFVEPEQFKNRSSHTMNCFSRSMSVDVGSSDGVVSLKTGRDEQSNESISRRRR